VKRAPHFCRILCILLLCSPAAQAGSIDFEDRSASNGAAPLSDEYADRGVDFVTQDGATWSGMSSGDPGGWQLEGTRGPAFLGLQSASSVTIAFDTPVTQFKLDMARGEGTSANFFDLVLISGLRAGRPVDSQQLFLGPVNAWKAIELAGEVDRVAVFSFGFYRDFRFGVDNLRWDGGPEPEPTVATVEIDVKPGDGRNVVHLGSRGVVPVALYGSEAFDVAEVVGDQITFGQSGAKLAHHSGPHLDDLDDDGHPDLMLHFAIPDLGMAESDDLACVHGTTRGGAPFKGCDGVNPVPARK
jgi:hypothetical protein